MIIIEYMIQGTEGANSLSGWLTKYYGTDLIVDDYQIQLTGFENLSKMTPKMISAFFADVISLKERYFNIWY